MQQSQTKFTILFILLIIIGFCSCSILQTTISEKVKEPKVDFIDAKISGLSFEKIDLLFDLKIFNPNSIGIKLAGLDYDFLLDGNRFIKGNQDKGIEIPSKGEENIQLPLSLAFMDIYQIFQNLRDKGMSNYQIKCGFSFDVPILGVVRIPVSKSGEVPMVKLPKISFSSLKLDKLTLAGADMKLSLKMDNPNVFSMILDSMQYDFKLNEQSIISGLSNKIININEKSESNIDIPITIDFLKTGAAVFQILNGNKDLNYQLNGNVDLTTSLPLLKQAKIPFNLSGKTGLLR